MAVLSNAQKPTQRVKEKEETNIFQMKEQDKTSETDLNEADILPDKDFKVMVIKILTKVRSPLGLKER